MHVIRLRGPWSKTIAGSTVAIDVPEPTPSPVLATSALSAGSLAIYERRFNRPTGLQAATRVLLGLSHWSGTVIRLEVNGQLFTLSDPPVEIDITDALLHHNRISISLEPLLAQMPRLDGDVTLKIYESEMTYY